MTSQHRGTGTASHAASGLPGGSLKSTRTGGRTDAKQAPHISGLRAPMGPSRSGPGGERGMDLRDLTGKCQHLGHNEGGAAGRPGPGLNVEGRNAPEKPDLPLSPRPAQAWVCPRPQTKWPNPGAGTWGLTRRSALSRFLPQKESRFCLREESRQNLETPRSPSPAQSSPEQVGRPTRAPDSAPGTSTWLTSCQTALPPLPSALFVAGMHACLPSPPGGLLHTLQNPARTAPPLGSLPCPTPWG